jgi:hypothetical protein
LGKPFDLQEDQVQRNAVADLGKPVILAVASLNAGGENQMSFCR